MVDANTGAYVTFNETTKDLSKAILSSSSIPFVFPSQPWEIEGAKMVGIDGGTAWGTNLVSVVQRCRELVDSDSKITVDIVVCDSHQISQWDDKGSAINNFLRFEEIKKYNDAVANIARFMLAFPDVNFRYFVSPSGPVADGLNMLNADNSTITWPM